MEIKCVKMKDLNIEEMYNLSFPLKPELYNELREKFAPLPFIIINNARKIVFGIDYYHFLNSQNVVYVDVLQIDTSDKEALFLNFNLKEKMTGVNLFEKLVFLKRISRLAETAEIYRKTNLEINVNSELMEKFDLMLCNDFQVCLVEERIVLKTALKLCDFLPEDREVLLELFSRVSFSSSFQLRILEMTEEILFRDKCLLSEVFNKLAVERYMELEKPQKQIIDALFKFRNPIYLESESRWEEDIKRLNFPGNLKVTHFPFFEKKQLEVKLHLKDAEELKGLIKKLKS